MGKTKQPIMTLEEERFMAFEGLLQWTQAVVTQSVRVTAARDKQNVDLRSRDPLIRQQAIRNFHSECHFFVIAAYKLIEYHQWASTFDFVQPGILIRLARFQQTTLKTCGICGNI